MRIEASNENRLQHSFLVLALVRSNEEYVGKDKVALQGELVPLNLNNCYPGGGVGLPDFADLLP